MQLILFNDNKLSHDVSFKEIPNVIISIFETRKYYYYYYYLYFTFNNQRKSNLKNFTSNL